MADKTTTNKAVVGPTARRARTLKRCKPMAKKFKRGDHVEWNSEVGRVRGVIVRKVISAVRVKGYRKAKTKIVLCKGTSLFVKAAISSMSLALVWTPPSVQLSILDLASRHQSQRL